MNYKVILLLVFIQAQVFHYVIPSRVSVSEGGYRNVLLALGDEIPESEAEALQIGLTKLFAAASASLKTATRGRLYFAEVKVLIPASWKVTSSSKEWDFSEGWENFDEADFRVTTTGDLRHGDDPYAVQDLGCGHQGRYVHFDKEFIIKSNTDAEDLLNNSAKAIVREWVRYRYGVFDEDGVNNAEYPDFYYNPKGEWVVNMCNNTVVKLDLENCAVNPETNNNENCDVVLDADQDTSLHSSIMTTILHNHVDEFCDNGLEKTHNADAPNRHNVLCGQRSVWEILNRHGDFSLPGVSPTQSIIPIVTFVQSQQPRIFIHWDNGAIDESQKQAYVDAVYEFITFDLPVSRNLWLAASDNLNTPSTVVPKIVLNMNAEAIAFDVTNHFNENEATEFSKLSAALWAVPKIWNDNELPPKGSIIILISQRVDESLSLSEIITALTEEGITLHLVTAEQKTVSSLGPLAQGTGGRIFPVTLSGELSVGPMKVPCLSQVTYLVQINQALSAILNDVLVGNSDKIIHVYQQTHTLDPSSAEGTFTVDTTLESFRTNFYVYTCHTGDVTIHLTNPSGAPVPVLPTNIGSRKEDLQEEGTWAYSISAENKLTSSLAVVVTSRAKRNVTVEPVTVRGWVKTIDNPNWPEVILLASVMQGSSPVSGACVKAVVTSENGNASEIAVRDIGRGDPDVVLGDGIYTNYFSPKHLASEYRVELLVTVGGTCGETAARSSAEVITRTYFVGTFQMPSGTWGDNPYPPGRITDLRIEKPLGEYGTVQIGWTATGEDLDEGSAAMYVVKCASSVKELDESFDQLPVVNLAQVNGQPIAAVQSGTKISATFAPKNESDVFCAIKAADAMGKTSTLSNSVTINPPVPGNGTQIVGPPDEKRFTRLQIIGISALSIACFIILLLLLIIIFLCLTRKKKDKVDKKEAKKTGKNQGTQVLPPEDTVFNIPISNIRFGSQHSGSVASSSRDWDSDAEKDDRHSEVGSDATNSRSWMAYQPTNRKHGNNFMDYNERTPIAGPKDHGARNSRRRSSSPESRVDSFGGVRAQRPLSTPPKPPPKNTNAFQYPQALQLGVHNFAYSHRNDSYDEGSIDNDSNVTKRTRREVQV